MTGLNLHEIAGSALAFVNPWQDMIFTKKTTQWMPDSRTPIVKTEVVQVQGKIQPANLQTLAEIGYTLREYQYWRIYLNLNTTQLDKLRQLGSDTFICNGEVYRIADKSDWQQNGWTEAYCYLDKSESVSTIKINTNPLNSTVLINGVKTKTLAMPTGSSVEYEASHIGFENLTGNAILEKDIILDLDLKKEE